MQVDTSDLGNAFSLAHKASEACDIAPRERAIFRAIAQTIWRSAGKEGDRAKLEALRAPAVEPR